MRSSPVGFSLENGWPARLRRRQRQKQPRSSNPLRKKRKIQRRRLPLQRKDQRRLQRSKLTGRKPRQTCKNRPAAPTRRQKAIHCARLRLRHHHSRKQNARLSRAEVIRAADEEAIGRGLNVGDYQSRKVKYDSASATWTVSYDQAAGATGSSGRKHFVVKVEDKTSKASVTPEE